MMQSLQHSSFTTVWVDVETNPSTDCGWISDSNIDLEMRQESNCAYLTELLNAVTAAGKGVGVYASHFMWNQTLGLACEAGSALPLWYARYNGETSCDDYESLSFGGWKKPYAKQYGFKPLNGSAIESCLGSVGADVDVICGA